MATSYNGWLAVKDGAGIDRSFAAAGVTFPAGVKSGDVATIFRWLIERLNTIEPIVPGWCWGYEYRPNVNNPSTLSCHSSGTAIDYNAPNHPNGARGTWSASEVAAIRGWLAELGGVVQWGADFSGTKDEMHFEINGSALAVAVVAARIATSPGKAATPVPAKPAQPIELESDMGMVALRDTETGIDYLVGAPFVFVMVESGEAYDRYFDAGMVDKPHGQGFPCKTYEVNWYRDKILAWRRAAGLPGAENVEAVIPKA